LKLFEGVSERRPGNLGNDADDETFGLAKYYVDNAKIRSAEIRFLLSSEDPNYYPSAMLSVDGFLEGDSNDPAQYLQARYIKAKGALQGAALFLDYGNVQDGLALLSQAADIIGGNKSAWVRIGGRYISNSELDGLKNMEEKLSSGEHFSVPKMSDFAGQLRDFVVSMKPIKYPRAGFLPDNLC